MAVSKEDDLHYENDAGYVSSRTEPPASFYQGARVWVDRTKKRKGKARPHRTT